MASSSEVVGGFLDPEKCSKLSIEEKRELVYELSKMSHASEMLQSWSRQEILQILCAEMGKERKYTGLTKLKIIEHLLKIVSEKKSGEQGHLVGHEEQLSSLNGQKILKRQRKADNPSRLPVLVNDSSLNNISNETSSIIYCKNTACKAILRQEDTFCKRCSCCICFQYDDNKDPSLWLVCSSEPPFEGSSCGMSCHLECALKHEKSSIGKDRQQAGLDGSFNCPACGKTNDLLGCWRKQLLIAKDTRRVDILCYRLSLSQKLLSGTSLYQKLSEIVAEAINKLEVEIGPLTGLPVKMARGIVNRLSSGPEVQQLCSAALVSLERMFPDTAARSSPQSMIQGSLSSKSSCPLRIRIEDALPTTLAVIVCSDEPSPSGTISYTLWHRKAHDRDYPVISTCTIFVPNKKFIVTGLAPGTQYQFKVVSIDRTTELDRCEVQFSTPNCGEEVTNLSTSERSQSPATNCSSLSNPSSVEDETNNTIPYCDHNEDRANNYISYCKDSDIGTTDLSDAAANCTLQVYVANSADEVSLLGDGRSMDIDNPDMESHALKVETKNLPQVQIMEYLSTDNGSDTQVETGIASVPFRGSSDASLPITPCRLEMVKDVPGKRGKAKLCNKELENGSEKGEDPQDGSTSKKRSEERQDEDCMGNSLADGDFEHYVKVIRWLECEGHIEKNFRQKFLTWYSLRATSQEVRIVKAFVDTFMEDPAALAEQLVDTFSDCVSSKRASVVPAGFCMKLWH